MAETPGGKNKLLRTARFYAGGYDISGDARTIGTLANDLGEVEDFGWDATVKSVITDGRRTVGISGLQSILNDDTGRSFDVLSGAGGDLIVTIAFGSASATSPPAIPDPCYMLAGIHLGDMSGFDAGIATLETAVNAKTGTSTGNPLGVILANSTTTTTEDLGSHDNEGATSDGWHSSIHVTAGSGTFTFALEHSTDDAAYSTLGTFTVDGSSVTAEHISGTGTVNQYVRLATSGTGSATIVVAFARN